MWTSFFYLDTRTWFGPGKKLVSYTPHADWTTRGVFPDGIRAKDTPGELFVDQMQGQVTSAIRANVPLYDALNSRDYLIGFGYQILGPDQLRGIAGRLYGSASFTNRIASSGRWTSSPALFWS
jgi:hypothetical protein